ncbi:FlgD immunoglobulin-like domain containing protein [Desulfobacula toluolica]|uniref:Basal-body rod modification protein FlgD n=1 Tax=Desulfobacula toluolica (strain DSM 7467 / Tol2) TaxID=651182 RepID=K0NJR0_DESTT|nr:FlgD immunoglobulin-like domain containing protein [Desulfobacula toluolica]CCK81736.1 FlgD: predicted flagellar hook capping protein [Desulfobacula toluolica Tol2]
MSVISTGNSSLDQINNSYKSSEKVKSEKEDALGRDTFLTMLVAQLQNQDPLNPQDGADFSAQLAQFSQLEQLININESMGGLTDAYSKGSEGDAIGYVGKQVTGNMDTMTVDDGTVSGGFYTLDQSADVMITITDADGNTVKTLFEGQRESGSQTIAWDGTNNAGDAVEDGSYQYTVMANAGYGYTEVPSSITGTVEGVAYNDGKAYLIVKGVLLDPQSLTAVADTAKTIESGSADSALSYLGKTVTSDLPIVLVEKGSVSGKELTFFMDAAEGATIKIYDESEELVRTITLSSEDTTGGENKVQWDGLADSGYRVSDGLYYYGVETGTGFAKTSVSEEVSGIKYINGTQYLVLNDSGRLAAISSITGIN